MITDAHIATALIALALLIAVACTLVHAYTHAQHGTGVRAVGKPRGHAGGRG